MSPKGVVKTILFLVMTLLFLNIQHGFGYDETWVRRTKFKDEVKKGLKLLDPNPGVQCFDKKGRGDTPSAEIGDSPIETFGYPDFNGNKVTVRAQTALSWIGGHKQPVKLGSKDYIVNGKPAEILAFFSCFGDYKVIGSSLDVDGKWKPNLGNLSIQLQNAPQVQGKDAFDIMFKYTLDSLVKYLSPVKIVDTQTCDLVPELCGVVLDFDKLQKLLNKTAKYLSIGPKVVDKIEELFAQDMTLKEKTIEFYDTIKNEFTKEHVKGKWKGWENVNRGKRLLVTLTMYPKPENNVRSTYVMTGSTVSMNDIWNVLAGTF